MEHPPQKPDQQRFEIPEHELEITASRAGGPGGQHVNTSSTRITVRWNIPATQILTEQEKQRVMDKLASQLTVDGDLIVHHASSRSQQQNKEAAIHLLTEKIRQALHIPKKRMKTRASKSSKEARLSAKSRHSSIKKMRSKKFED